MKTRKMTFDIPEPTKKGACRKSCPIARFSWGTLFCRMADNSGCLFPQPSPGPRCIWGKNSQRTTKGPKR